MRVCIACLSLFLLSGCYMWCMPEEGEAIDYRTYVNECAKVAKGQE